MRCQHTTDCPLYTQFQMKSILKYWTVTYCEGSWETCERYKRSLQGEDIPSTLLPNGQSLVAPKK